MKITHLAALAALVLGTGFAAHADTLNGVINLTGSSVTNTSTDTIRFNDDYGMVVPTTNGSFAAFLGTTADFNTSTLHYGSFSAPYQLFTDSIGGFFNRETLAYTIDSISFFGAAGTGYTIMGTGDFTLNGQDSTLANFTYTTQPGSDASFSITANTAVAPEPASLALFGTGLLGIVGIARRRFNV